MKSILISMVIIISLSLITSCEECPICNKDPITEPNYEEIIENLKGDWYCKTTLIDDIVVSECVDSLFIKYNMAYFINLVNIKDSSLVYSMNCHPQGTKMTVNTNYMLSGDTLLVTNGRDKLQFIDIENFDGTLLMLKVISLSHLSPNIPAGTIYILGKEEY